MVASPNPSEAAIQAWARLVRVSGALLDAVEAELKAAGFPPLVWCGTLPIEVPTTYPTPPNALGVPLPGAAAGPAPLRELRNLEPSPSLDLRTRP